MTEALLTSLLSFAIASLVIELVPGPNQTYLAALTITSGMRAGLSAVAGIALGLSIYGLAAALGVAAIVEHRTRFTSSCAGPARFIFSGLPCRAGVTIRPNCMDWPKRKRAPCAPGSGAA